MTFQERRRINDGYEENLRRGIAKMLRPQYTKVATDEPLA